MEKKVSKVKVGLCALLGYSVLNMIRNILFGIASLITSLIGVKSIRYRLEEISFFVTFYLGYIVCNKIGEKLLKTDDAVRRYKGTVGIFFIINYTIFIIDYFICGEGNLFFLVLPLLIGVGILISSRKEKETEEEI